VTNYNQTALYLPAVIILIKDAGRLSQKVSIGSALPAVFMGQIALPCF
jgi:hypothetical protein